MNREKISATNLESSIENKESKLKEMEALMSRAEKFYYRFDHNKSRASFESEFKKGHDKETRDELLESRKIYLEMKALGQEFQQHIESEIGKGLKEDNKKHLDLYKNVLVYEALGYENAR